MPVTTVARETRRFDSEHSAYIASADRRNQALEAWPRDPAAGTAEIVVDHLDRGPAERTSAIGEAILATATLMVVQKLVGR